MKKTENNTAYIDGANLYNGTKNLDWNFDYGKFRVWLKEKYAVNRAYIFLGLIPKYKDLYTALQQQGYTLVFKEITFDSLGKAKGNCDADLVVMTMKEAFENSFDKAILVSSDGDYTPLVKFLLSKNKILTVLSPYKTERCSILLKRTGVNISYIADKKEILKFRKEKAPNADKTT